VTIDNSIFNIELTPPQNFSEYREIELMSTYANLYNSVKDNPILSKRFALKKYLGLTEDEIDENEKMWREENDVEHMTQDEGASADLRSVGVNAPPMDMDFSEEPDMEGGEEPDLGGEEPDLGGDIGAETAAPDTQL
jgi:hypothetical protein